MFFLFVSSFSFAHCKSDCNLVQKVFFWAWALHMFLWKLAMDKSSTNENKMNHNNETIEICMNDVIREEIFE